VELGREQTFYKVGAPLVVVGSVTTAIGAWANQEVVWIVGMPIWGVGVLLGIPWTVRRIRTRRIQKRDAPLGRL
jgi:hypothetical protein